MHIIRFIDESGTERYGQRVDEKSAKVIDGDIFGSYKVTDKTVSVGKLLAPIAPKVIFCIGLNYRKHAE